MLVKIPLILASLFCKQLVHYFKWWFILFYLPYSIEKITYKEQMWEQSSGTIPWEFFFRHPFEIIFFSLLNLLLYFLLWKLGFFGWWWWSQYGVRTCKQKWRLAMECTEWKNCCMLQLHAILKYTISMIRIGEKYVSYCGSPNIILSLLAGNRSFAIKLREFHIIQEIWQVWCLRVSN